MAFLWAVGCLIVSTLVIFWSGALLAICNQMCTCQWFGDKRIHYDQVGEYQALNEQIQSYSNESR